MKRECEQPSKPTRLPRSTLPGRTRDARAAKFEQILSCLFPSSFFWYYMGVCAFANRWKMRCE
jgi:hypothetical protein